MVSYGGFLKWVYPQLSSMFCNGCSIINHPAIGVASFMETLISCIHLDPGDFLLEQLQGGQFAEAPQRLGGFSGSQGIQSAPCRSASHAAQWSQMRTASKQRIIERSLNKIIQVQKKKGFKNA